MMGDKRIVALAALAAIATISGCICCCGQDSMFSLLKKPVSAINFPSQINIGGKIYDKVYSNEYLDPGSVKAGLKRFAGKLGYSASGDISEGVDRLIDLSGIKQYKSFKYTDGSSKGVLAGLVGKADAPSAVTGGYEAMKAAASAAMPSINDPAQNTGSISAVSSAGGTSVGHGGDRYTMKVDGQDCYVVTVKYSNMYVMAYSFDSFDAAEAGIEMAIKQIDEAAAS